MTNGGGAGGQAMPPAGLRLVEDVLACPICGEPLTLADRQLRCPSKHSFDIAKQGYASLVVGGRTPKTGDTAAMVEARDAFLRRGAYEPIADAVGAAIDAVETVAAGGGGGAAAAGAAHATASASGGADVAAAVGRGSGAGDDAAGAAAVVEVGPGIGDPLVVDIAGGTGYYLGRVLDGHPGFRGLTLDLSPLAARRAARSHPRAAAGTADAWAAFPVRTARADVVLSIFGPRNGPEMLRVLRPGGVLVVVTPQPGHLVQLRDALGMIGIAERKDERLDAQLAGFELVARTAFDYTVALGRDDIRNEVLMGPSAHHLDPVELDARLASLAGGTADAGGIGRTDGTDGTSGTDVTIAVTVSTFRRP
ncbi:putative RNA methyltransferase [Plantibacter sp. YIM 135249]|uniref:putative RNA methyltransferase n=1 Tax=Plantibacter sp. YIM 135249 TaxID=3423918 RepID=UPI003D33E153